VKVESYASSFSRAFQKKLGENTTPSEKVGETRQRARNPVRLRSGMVGRRGEGKSRT